MAKRTTERDHNIRLLVLWGLFILKLILGRIIIKTESQDLVYMFCTFIPFAVYQGVHGYRIQFLIQDHYPQVLAQYPQLALISTYPIGRRIEEKIEIPALRKELAFLRQLRFLCIIWVVSFAIKQFYNIISMW